MAGLQTSTVQYESTPTTITTTNVDEVDVSYKDGSFHDDFNTSEFPHRKFSSKNSKMTSRLLNISINEDDDSFPSELGEETDNINTEEETNISDSSLFKLDSATYDEIKNEPEFLVTNLRNINSSELQHDAPLLPLVKNENIQFFDMGSKHLSSIQKAKTVYNTEDTKAEKWRSDSKELTDANLSVLPLNESENLKKNVLISPRFSQQPTNTTKQVLNNTYSPMPKTEYVKFPTTNISMHSTNRVVLNITVATGFENNTLNSLQPIYVLSVLIPTDGINKHDIALNTQEIHNTKPNAIPLVPVTTNPQINDADNDNSGGTCECSCPCLDPISESSESQSTDDYDIFNYLNLSSEGSREQTSSTKNPITSSISSTDQEIPNDETTISTNITETLSLPRNCTEQFKQPPAPPILILEGRILKAQRFDTLISYATGQAF